MNKSKIEWCDSTWNPVTGCLHECEYCYAKKIANRFGGNRLSENCYKAPACGIDNCKECEKYGQIEKIHVLDLPQYNFYPQKRLDAYPYGFEPTFHKYRLNEPKIKRKKQNIFVCSMSDLFGEWIPDKWIEEVFNTCIDTEQHTYMFLTKNPGRYDRFIDYYACEERSFGVSEGYWDNFWFGTTITQDDKENRERAWELLKFSEGYKFLSIEPLHGEFDLNKYELLLQDCRNKFTLGRYIDWVIVGAETGPGAKPPKTEWVQNIIDQCRAANVPVFLKDNLNWHKKIQEYPSSIGGPK